MNTQSSQAKSAATRALPSQVNWLRSMEADGPFVVHEYPLYSDAHLTGELREGLGPYSFINTVPAFGPGTVNIGMVLRVSIYLDQRLPDMSKTDESRYHGGSLADELAALASMALGVRVWADGLSREFAADGDPYGQPWEWSRGPEPLVHVGRNGLPLLPSVARSERSLTILRILQSIPRIESGRYIKLVRACRSYQNALWMAESEPAIAWLMLISALETAAGDSYRKDASHEKRLRDSNPKLVKYLEDNCDTRHIREIAKLIAPASGATKKFVDFAMRFMPTAPPDRRPTAEGMRFKWTKDSLLDAVRTIYRYRSRYLHGGLPFPRPMLERRGYGAEDLSVAPEVPSVGIATYSSGGVWMAEDLPMSLELFHYIARGALVNWWRRELDGSG